MAKLRLITDVTTVFTIEPAAPTAWFINTPLCDLSQFSNCFFNPSQSIWLKYPAKGIHDLPPTERLFLASLSVMSYKISMVAPD